MSAQEKPQVPNLGISSDHAISMDTERASEFIDVMYRINRNILSLSAAAASFPQRDLLAGEMDPGATVSAFCRPILEDINLVYQFMENDEPRRPVEEGGAQ